jgi:hypothetical protein
VAPVSDMGTVAEWPCSENAGCLINSTPLVTALLVVAFELLGYDFQSLNPLEKCIIVYC